MLVRHFFSSIIAQLSESVYIVPHTWDHIFKYQNLRVKIVIESTTVHLTRNKTKSKQKQHK